jgi:hypothetical protein
MRLLFVANLFLACSSFHEDGRSGFLFIASGNLMMYENGRGAVTLDSSGQVFDYAATGHGVFVAKNGTANRPQASHTESLYWIGLTPSKQTSASRAELLTEGRILRLKLSPKGRGLLIQKLMPDSTTFICSFELLDVRTFERHEIPAMDSCNYADWVSDEELIVRKGDSLFYLDPRTKTRLQGSELIVPISMGISTTTQLDTDQMLLDLYEEFGGKSSLVLWSSAGTKELYRGGQYGFDYIATSTRQVLVFAGSDTGSHGESNYDYAFRRVDLSDSPQPGVSLPDLLGLDRRSYGYSVSTSCKDEKVVIVAMNPFEGLAYFYYVNLIAPFTHRIVLTSQEIRVRKVTLF